jgi:hypothetical protein
MHEYFDALMVLLLGIALLYGIATVFLNWSRTVPAGAESDFEFAHHQPLPVLPIILSDSASAVAPPSQT